MGEGSTVMGSCLVATTCVIDISQIGIWRRLNLEMFEFGDVWIWRGLFLRFHISFGKDKYLLGDHNFIRDSGIWCTQYKSYYFVLWIIALWDSRCRLIIDLFQVFFSVLGLSWHRVLRTGNHLFPIQINFKKITEEISIFGIFFFLIGIFSILRQPVSPNYWFISDFLCRSWFVMT